MPGHRMDRVNEDILRELSVILRELKDPRVTGVVSVTRVEVASDLSQAKVFVSSVDGDPQLAKTLNSAAGFIRHTLSERLTVRRTPQLHFVFDDSIARSVRLSKLIDDVRRSDEK